MNVFDFITQEEIDDLPEDLQLAFSVFVQHAQRRLAEMTRHMDPQDEIQWRAREEARHGFTNIVLAAARRLQIEPFQSIEVPKINRFDDDAYRQFIADVDHYMTQLALDNSQRGRRDSTHIPSNSKDRIRSHLHHLREAVELSSLNDAKKASLFSRIDEFEQALDKSRLNILAVARLTLELIAIPGTVWASYEVLNKLVWNINQTVAEAKMEDDEQRKLPPTPKPFALIPPRAPEPDLKKDKGFRRDLDDEIPF